MANNPRDIILESIKSSLARSGSEVANAALGAGTEFVKNGINNALGIKREDTRLVSNNSTHTESNVRVKPSQAVVDVGYEDGEDQENDDIDTKDVIPIMFDSFSKEENLECAVACFKLWGYKDTDCSEDESPDIVAVSDATEMAFCGTIEALQSFCVHHDIDPEWTVYGVNDDGTFDSSKIQSMRVSKRALNYVTASLLKSNYDNDAMAKQFRENHVSSDAQVVRVVRNIRHMNNVPLAHFAVPYAIIYGAEKDGKFDVYVHEFGENSKKTPMMYTVGDGKEEPESLVIHGGDMRVRRGYIIH